MKLEFIRNWIYAINIPKPVQEFLLEALRIAAIAAVSAVLVFLTSKVTMLPAEWQGIAIMVLTTIGKALDKYKFVDNTDNRVKGPNNFGLIGF
jgi:hypothetical protein